MGEKDPNGYFAKGSHPTMRQIRYLSVLEEVGNTRGVIAEIAKRCGVNNAPVSRFLKACSENGLLHEDYSFTVAGKTWLTQYQNLIHRLSLYFEEDGMPEENVEEAIREMIEHVDADIISGMLRNMEEARKPRSLRERDRKLSGEYLKGILPPKVNTEISFMVYRLDSKEFRPSMADRGFEKPARLKHNSRGSFLILKVCDMTASSRITGKLMKGRLETLKYEENGELIQAQIRDDTLRIPLSACRIYKKPGGEIRGTVAITMTCNVGRLHMPESAAILLFWL